MKWLTFTIGLISSSVLLQSVGSAETILNVRSKAAGKEILLLNCSSCHAISSRDESQHLSAPPFRFLSRRYPVEQLAEALAEGIMSGHPDMPIFEFEPAQIDQIIDYLNSIQVGKN